jgi:formate dehydrogenase subunit beta
MMPDEPFFTNTKEGEIMSEAWIIHTHGSPLDSVRLLLKDLWQQADLHGMLVPVYHDGDSETSPQFVEDPEKLSDADPCVPVMPVNASKLVLEQTRRNPAGRYGAVLRSCEARALSEVTRRETLDLSGWLIIGIDCLASYDENDFEWRVQKAGSIEQVSRENLGHARQGGIALHRFRNACQMCTSPEASHADVCISLLGLPVKQIMLLRAKDKQTAERYHLDWITDDIAPHALLAQQERILNTLSERRMRTMDRMIQNLSAEMPEGVDELVTHLQNCAPCRECLQACPIYSLELAQAGLEQIVTKEAAVRWMLSCVSCGMCEQSCPNHLPLTAIFIRINQELKQEMVTA